MSMFPISGIEAKPNPMNCISYSIFGYNNQYENCFPERAYIRGLGVNIRMAEVLYPGWKVHVSIDRNTYNSPYKDYFDRLTTDKKIRLEIKPAAALCEMMLWRLLPCFALKASGDIMYERVICRDADSLLTYRERQAVAYWEQGTKMAHAITDSISHTVALMGGMIGFQSGPLMDRIGARSFDDMMNLSAGIDFNRKGADQTFLNTYVLPKVADSITEHYCLGMPQSFRGDCHNMIEQIDLTAGELHAYHHKEEALKETNALGFHIGASGFQTDGTVKWLGQYGMNNEYWSSVEKQFSSIFYWRL